MADAGNYFQTDASREAEARRVGKKSNKAGKPIGTGSKILALAPVASSIGEVERAVYVAEAVGVIRCLNIDTGKTERELRGPGAPLTSVAAVSGHSVLAGCWDGAVWHWSEGQTGAVGADAYRGHADFVKSLCVFRCGVDGVFLATGGADATIVVWDLKTGEKVQVVKTAESRGVLDLAVDPLESAEGGEGEVVLWSAGSSRDLRRWGVKRDGIRALPVSGSEEALRVHETSVNRIRFDDEGDLWTASSDKTAKCLVRERGWAVDTVLKHADYVRDVLPLPGGRVATACRDEDVRVWTTTGTLVHVFSGHFEEVTCLARLGRTLVSGSIDGTVRRWDLADVGQEGVRGGEEREMEEGEAEEEDREGQRKNALTAEEEAELAELMD